MKTLSLDTPVEWVQILPVHIVPPFAIRMVSEASERQRE